MIEPQPIAEKVCEMVGARAEAICRVARNACGLTRYANSFIHQHHGEDTASVSLEVAVEGRVSSSSTTRIEDDDLARLVDETIEGARLSPLDPRWPGVAGPGESVSPGHTDRSTVDAGPDERVAHVAQFVEAGPGLLAAGFVDTGLVEVALATTGGRVASGSSTRATLDGIHQTATSAGNAHQTSVRFSDLDGAAAGRRAADLARRGENQIDVAPGRYEVVLSPECVATVAVFLGLYGFGGRSYLDGQSFVDIGSQQFDAAFQLVDDPEDPRSIGVGFDDEGTSKHRLVLVEGGVTRTVVHDRRTAKEAGAESTGHALAGSGFGPLPHNLVVGRGDQSPEELVAGVERGLFVSTFNYCRILDPRTQVVTGLTRNGTFLIEDGEITSPVTNLRFTQSFVEALGPERVMAIGNDQRHADNEFGPGLVVAPSMRLAQWNFTGGAQG
ncbi:MAG: metallopeptidase TldD-related protein [Acidimicrobiia bacterium]